MTAIDEASGPAHRERSSRRRSSKARCSRSTTGPARSARWSAASTSAAASSTAPSRRRARSGRPSSRSCSRRRSIAATRRRRSSSTSPCRYNAGPGQPPYAPQNYDRKYEGTDHAAPRARAVAQRADREADGTARRRRRSSATRGASDSSRRCSRTCRRALGASEATLLEVTSAYSAFPNQGVRMQPYSIVKVARARRHRARGAAARRDAKASAPTRRS